MPSGGLTTLPSSLLASALDRWCGDLGEQPWLFQRSGEDWRWISWQTGAARIAGCDPRSVPPPDEPASPEAYLAELGRRLLAPDALSRAERELRALEAALGPPRGRDVLVFGTGPSDPAERLLLDWILCTGGAAVFEADPARLYVTTVWARPTVVHGPAELLSGLGAFLRGYPRAAKPLIRRARTVVVTGATALSPEDRDGWTETGQRVVELRTIPGIQTA